MAGGLLEATTFTTSREACKILDKYAGLSPRKFFTVLALISLFSPKISCNRVRISTFTCHTELNAHCCTCLPNNDTHYVRSDPFAFISRGHYRWIRGQSSRQTESALPITQLSYIFVSERKTSATPLISNVSSWPFYRYSCTEAVE
jgi:hypothetical protein